jgi:hypothetical protein
MRSLMLMLPATAGAEPSWVLWATTLAKPRQLAGTRRTLIRAVPSRRECEARAEYIREQFPASPAASEVTAQFLCIPDTIDPRGPKQ